MFAIYESSYSCFFTYNNHHVIFLKEFQVNNMGQNLKIEMFSSGDFHICLFLAFLRGAWQSHANFP